MTETPVPRDPGGTRTPTTPRRRIRHRQAPRHRPGGATLASFLEEVAGDDDRYPGATDDELLGAICAWDRAEAAMAAGKHAAARS